eukprot:COSAG06_NODE_1335_length_9833_cov_37.824205_6_plen_315_part_00
MTASVGGRVISNGSWTWDIRSQAVAKYEFDLSLLPISFEAVLNTTIRCDSLGWSTVKFRDFQRYPANSAPSSLSHGQWLAELLNDTAAPNSVNVYRIGCSVAAPDDSNLSPNPSFEEPFLLGGITAWSGGRAGWWGDDGHDSRARLYTDTSDPQHGRYSLRINVPSCSAAGLTVPWAQDCSPHCNADSDGFRLAANTSYTIQLWARSEPPGMELQVVAGAWALDQAECNAFHVAGQYLRNQTLGGRTLNASWGRIAVVYKAAPEDQHLQLQILSGRGRVFIDNTFIGARPAGGYDGQLAETRLAWVGNSRARED